MGVIKQLDFVLHEINAIPNVNKKPKGGIASFGSRIGYALSLGFKEKEIFFFGLLQWVSISIGYLLWVQMLDWIPEEVWRSAANSDEGSIADWILFAWSFVCIGIAAFPVGILTGCMGAAHFLTKQTRQSTIASCLKLVLPQSWALWAFHWVDGWITVNRILDRLPRKDDYRSSAEKALAEALYYAWKLGVAGVLPSIVTGNGLLNSGKNSVVFVKDNFLEVAKLRAGYSALCWVVGISAYVASFFFLMVSGKMSGNIYTFYTWAAVPILIAAAVVILFLRPIYVLALCDLYSDHLEQKGTVVCLPKDHSKGMSAMIVFGAICVIIALVYFYRSEIGILDMLSTPFGEQ